MELKDIIRRIESILDDASTTTCSHCDQPPSYIRAKVKETLSDSKRRIVDLVRKEFAGMEQ